MGARVETGEPTADESLARTLAGQALNDQRRVDCDGCFSLFVLRNEAANTVEGCDTRRKADTSDAIRVASKSSDPSVVLVAPPREIDTNERCDGRGSYLSKTSPLSCGPAT